MIHEGAAQTSYRPRAGNQETKNPHSPCGGGMKEVGVARIRTNNAMPAWIGSYHRLGGSGARVAVAEPQNEAYFAILD